MSEQLTTVAEVFEVMPSRFDAAAARGLHATYQFDLTGVDGGTYHIEVVDGRCQVGEGRASSPNITITMTASDYLDMINGLLNPQLAFMGGKLKIKGDMSLAVKIQELFPTG